jgi:hypothetical protein
LSRGRSAGRNGTLKEREKEKEKEKEKERE